MRNPCRNLSKYHPVEFEIEGVLYASELRVFVPGSGHVECYIATNNSSHVSVQVNNT